jgi:hypothetical protein
MTGWGSRVLAGLCAALVLASSSVFLVAPAPANAAVADAVVSDPPSGIHSHPLWDSYHQLTPFGYEEHEYFVSGTATDATGATAPYTTRIIVTRPSSAARFNGTVVLDWVNVTAQFEIPVDSLEARQLLLRDGYAFVHVSAQKTGICCTPLTPKIWDPVRYAALKHPGDEFAFDMFSQIAKAVRTPAGPNRPMGSLHVDRVLAAGQSQSASKLYQYVNGVAPTSKVIDGFLIHGGGKKTFPAKLTTKVLNLLSDLEADPSAPDPSEPNYRVWEIAGAAHSDFFIGYQAEFGQGPRTAIDAPQQSPAQFANLLETAGNYGEQLHPMLLTCVVAGATMPMHYATSTAIHVLDRWVRTGKAPKNGPRFAFAPGGGLAKDDVGNTRGGIRLPPIEVPVARYVSTVCGLGGFTIPMTDQQIQARYPTHAGYYARMGAATDTAVVNGWLLPVDAVDMMRRACLARNRWGEPAGVDGCPSYAPPAFDSAPSSVQGAALAVPAATAPAPRAVAPVLPVTGGGEPLALIGGLLLLGLAVRPLRSRA